jgi:hypothetical protein
VAADKQPSPRAPVSGRDVTAAVSAWHAGAGDGLELHEYLGWSWEQYARWVDEGVAPDEAAAPRDDLGALAKAYYLHAALASSPDRRQRLATGSSQWAWDAVDDVVGDGEPAQVLAVLDALVAEPGADLHYLGAGPVEDILQQDPAVWDEPLSHRCDADERWRTAVGAAIPPDGSRRPRLSKYLRPDAS